MSENKFSPKPHIAGILMECNPLHEGHRYILQEARRCSEADAVIVLMSGDFAQRGIPAVEPKELRTRQLLKSGADLVLELPVSYAVSSAEYFARGGMQILHALGIVTDLAFGSESGDFSALLAKAQFLLHEPEDYQELLHRYLNQGLSFPAARTRAAAECSEHILLPDTANDILGVEYLRALMQIDSQQISHSDVNTASEPSGTGFLSSNTDGAVASAIPCLGGFRIHAIPRIQTASATQLRAQRQETGSGMFADDFSELLLSQLLSIQWDENRHFYDYAGISSDLSNRMERLLPQFISWTQFCELLKTRNITYTAVSRALLHILLGMDSGYTQYRAPSYVRVLGCRREALPLLSRLQHTTSLPVLTKLPKKPSPVLQLDLHASELYDLLLRKKASGDRDTLMQYSMKQYPSKQNSDTMKKILPASSDADRISEYSKPFLILS